ncbi:FadR/GntR family transcriptional regulator [Vallitalea guaymasensis]|uniref:FadR family transcriptional regulator n=1 Tax=Vallitalea guaymasensis TaxID=1185412 RepID=A0A8J8MEK9_9FIRM|nr:FadR/GntR family transcriptional regulator [Vallitalea guaymasensis]QUH31378.1 FadR family transcriptional regulator [Vallitalea guaymasensis]
MKERASDIVFRTIKENIISGKWVSGTKIMSETQLASELNVSRISVREAIEKLAALNILSKKQGGGTYVNDLQPSIYFNSLIPMLTLDRDNYMEILEFRLIFETQSMGLCVKRCTDDKIEELEECYHRMVKYEQDEERFTDEDLKFHMLIVEGANNSILKKVSEVLGEILRYHQKRLYKELGPGGGIKEHKMMLEAIKNRDEELATIYMRRHIERTIEDIKNTRID